MLKPSIKLILSAAALSSMTLLVACGGGGGASGSDSDTPDNPSIGGNAVTGPLDPVQSQLSSSVIEPLANTVDGTPLKSVLVCADTIVNQNVLDIVDTVLAPLQSAAANPGAINQAALTDAMNSLVVNLSTLLQGLAGTAASCSADGSLSLDQLQQVLTALNGTPLAPLSTQLGPVLQQIATQLSAGSGGGNGGADLQLSSAAALVAQLNSALQAALAQIPAQAYEAPVVGGTLSTISTALNDTQTLLNSALNYNAAGTRNALQTLLDHLLVNVTTQIVPLAAIEEQAGQPGVISSQIAQAANQLATLVAGTVGQVLSPAFDSLLNGALSPILDPIENQVLPAILGPLTAALSGGANGGTGGALGGTVLAPVVNLVQQVLGTLTGGLGGGTGTGGTGTGSGSSCPFANYPLLSILCGRG